MSEPDVVQTPLTAQTADGLHLVGQLSQIDNSAPRVVLIHSLALDATMWLRVLSALQGRYNVLCYDCRGHGSSERVPDHYTTQLFADDLGHVLDAAGWRQATVVGCSMGGCVAQQFAATNPQRTAGSVFIDTTAWYGPDAPTRWNERAEKAQAVGLTEMVDFQISRWFSEEFSQREPDVVQATARVFTSNDVDCYAASCRMLGSTDLRPLLGDIAGPCAVVCGSLDYATPPEMSQDLATALGCGDPIVLEQARHITPLERPAEIAQVVADVADKAAATTAGGFGGH
jgi:3-oxoadipate enol-lactonase